MVKKKVKIILSHIPTNYFQSKKREEEYEAVLNKLRKQFEERFNNNKESSSEGLDNYEKFRTLGTGSFGRVLLVKDKTKNTYHAMKVLSKQQLIRTKQVEHTLYEKKMLMSLHFPFIISMDACFKDNGYIYFVMPFINGGEMFTHLRK